MKKIFLPKTLMFLSRLIGVLLIIMFAFSILYAIQQTVITNNSSYGTMSIYELVGMFIGMLLVFFVTYVIGLIILGTIYNYLQRLPEKSDKA